MGFFSKSFKEAIQEFAEANEWEISELDKDYAEIAFETEEGDELVLWVGYDSETARLAFSVVSYPTFEEEDDIPHELSTYLLQRNSELMVGDWGLEEYDEGWSYTIYHVQVLPEGVEHDMNAEHFRAIAEALLSEVEEFNNYFEEEYGYEEE